MSNLVISQEVRRRILTTQYGPGQRIPPERELLEEFGCSRLTVAKALALLAKEGLIERQQGRGTFVTQRNPQAQPGLGTPHNGGRAQSRGNVIKYISPGQTAGRSSRDDVLNGLHGILDESGYHVSVDFYGDLEQHLQCLSKAHDPQIAGVVLWPATHTRTAEAVAKLMDAGIPLVLLDTYIPGVDSDYVVTNNIEGAALMVDYLSRLGHQRIAYLTMPTNRTSLRDRLAGYVRGMLETCLPVDSQSVIFLEHSGEADYHNLSTQTSLVKAVDTLLSQPSRPTALFASNDTLAIALQTLLRMRGLRVPEDISVVGYDGIEAGEFGPTPLTTVKQDFREMAAIAARILLERFDGRLAPLRYHRLIDPQLVVRASCAAPRM